MHYLDEGAGDPVLLLHGEPTWSFLYRKMIPRARAAWRAWSRPTTSASAARTSRRTAAGTRTTATSTCCAARRGARPAALTVVLQDWGGPLGFRLAVEHPERIERARRHQHGIFSGRPPGEAWLRFRAFVRRVGTDSGRAADAHHVPGRLPDDVVAGYDAPFPTPESKTGVLMFPELVPDSTEHPSAAEDARGARGRCARGRAARSSCSATPTRSSRRAWASASPS